MPGPVLLCGGNEFEEASLPVSNALLDVSGKKQARLAILPVAGTDNPRKRARSGVGHFKSLNVSAEAVMIADRQSANDGSATTGLESASAIYLTDGSPAAVVEILADTNALNRLQHYWDVGATLAASGAAAMALCDLYWDSGIWEKGLGLFKGIVVLPHHEYLVGRFSSARLRQDLPAGYTILGIEDSTGVLVTGLQARVVGAETVTVYHAESEVEVEPGSTFSLDMPVA